LPLFTKQTNGAARKVETFLREGTEQTLWRLGRYTLALTFELVVSYLGT